MTSRSPPFPEPAVNTDNLCARCSTLDFDSISSRSWPSDKQGFEDTILTIDGTTDDSWASPSCILCQLFKSSAPPILDTSRAWRNERSIILRNPDSTREIIGDVTKSQPVLAVKNRHGSQHHGEFCPNPDKSLCLQSDSARIIRILDPQYIDFSILQHWLSTCLNSHNSCGLEDTSELQGLQVINVDTQELEIAGKGTRYVALSYVWGQQKETRLSTPLSHSETALSDGLEVAPVNLGSPLLDSPPTIQDAMKVTKRLGFQYLWVDRYCVPQGESNAKDRHDQIKQMDRIYRQAGLTIIAAAGEGPDHGLPGVGSTTRIPQPLVRIGKHTLVSTMTSARVLIYSTPWYSRAWTYQEGICSRRRLLFTDEQVFFECQQMSCRETVDHLWPIKQYHIFSQAHTTQGGLDSALTHITNYSKRQLTYDSDALNAILGVLRLYSRREVPVFHFWGVLIAPRFYIDTEVSSGSTLNTSQNSISKAFLQMRRSFLSHDGLQNTFIKSLCWLSETSGRRRPGFPSWSWAGWTCPVTHSGITKDPRRFAVTVSIGYKSGHFKSLEYAYRHYIKTDKLKDTIGILRLRARVVKLKINVFRRNAYDIKEVGKPELFAWPMEQDDTFGAAQLIAPIQLLEPMDAETIALWQKESPHLLGILMQSYDDEQLPKGVLVLVVSKVHGGEHQRVGHLRLDSGMELGGRMKSKNVFTGEYVKIDVDERICRRKRWETNRIRDIDLV